MWRAGNEKNFKDPAKQNFKDPKANSPEDSSETNRTSRDLRG